MSNKKKIYTVATAHLDTVWSWDFETTVSKYIYNTLVDNFKLFKKYPTYTFSFEGSYRYELMEEYYPELFDKMKEYIKEGKMSDYQDHYYPSEMAVDAQIQTFLMKKDSKAFLKKFDTDWVRYNRDIIRKVEDYEKEHADED